MEEFLTNGPLHRQCAIIQKRLKLAFGDKRFTHEILPAQLTSAVWSDMVSRAPFVGLGWGGITGDKASGRQLEGTVPWLVALVAKNSRGGSGPRMTGDAQGPGLFGMAQTAALFLHGHREQAGTAYEAEGTITVNAIEHVYAEGWRDENAACALVNITMPLVLVQPYRLDDFLRLGATWTFNDSELPTDTDQSIRSDA